MYYHLWSRAQVSSTGRWMAKLGPCLGAASVKLGSAVWKVCNHWLGIQRGLLDCWLEQSVKDAGCDHWGDSDPGKEAHLAAVSPVCPQACRLWSLLVGATGTFILSTFWWPSFLTYHSVLPCSGLQVHTLVNAFVIGAHRPEFSVDILPYSSFKWVF